MTTDIGFCSKCGYVRQDTNGVPDNDCLCLAQKKHKPECRYLIAIASKIGIPCEKHGEDVCLICDKCDCK